MGLTGDGEVVGEAAAEQASLHPHSVVFDAKRMLGTSFNDARLQRDLKYWPFRVVEGPCGAPLVELEYQNQQRQYRPEDISAMLLLKARDITEGCLGAPVTEAVVTVPAYFTDPQLQATKEAAAMAGFREVQILNEPSAAAIAYGVLRPDNRETVLVFDLGGGNFDVSVIAVENGSIKTVAVSGEPHLGGADFDHRLLDFVKEDVESHHRKKLSPGAIGRLKSVCEQAKRILSSSTSAEIAVDAYECDKDYIATITRARFEHLCNDYFE